MPLQIFLQVKQLKFNLRTIKLRSKAQVAGTWWIWYKKMSEKNFLLKEITRSIVF